MGGYFRANGTYVCSYTRRAPHPSLGSLRTLLPSYVQTPNIPTYLALEPAVSLSPGPSVPTCFHPTLGIIPLSCAPPLETQAARYVGSKPALMTLSDSAHNSPHDTVGRSDPMDVDPPAVYAENAREHIIAPWRDSELRPYRFVEQIIQDSPKSQVIIFACDTAAVRAALSDSGLAYSYLGPREYADANDYGVAEYSNGITHILVVSATDDMLNQCHSMKLTATVLVNFDLPGDAAEYYNRARLCLPEHYQHGTCVYTFFHPHARASANKVLMDVSQQHHTCFSILTNH